MGLLDDAIREHLDLKRRHGVAEEEVRRQEQEALGPPRRGEVPEPLAPPGPAGAQTGLGEPAGAEEEDLPHPAPAGSVGAHAAPHAEPPADPVRDDEPAVDDGVTAAPEIEPEPGAGALAAEDDDVLEETPEFLQETPEHDRLWFEQKPPKDFDFDK